jgi:methenyltetrahydromethanopterin cyclohydrolase
MLLNEQAGRLADSMEANASALRIGVQRLSGARILDCGIASPGGLQSGLLLARVCLADRAEVSLVPSPFADLPGPAVQVSTDDPVLACMASQYAGWQVSVGKFFAMGSGPMRAAYAKEALFEHIPGREKPSVAVGVLETRKLPPAEVVAYLSERTGVQAEGLTLLCAPTASIAGTIQIVARSVETALHKLHELKFDLSEVVSGYGVAPLPPVAADDIGAIGRTNDAILYGAQVTLWVRSDDEQLAAIGPRVPSSASPDHGAPFVEIFERYHRDFYKIDPMLFSPAVICLVNLKCGRARSGQASESSSELSPRSVRNETRHVFGRLEPEVLRRSFGQDQQSS